MPNDWNPETYRLRAKQWHDKAVALPSGDERQACEVLAQGYARLAQLIEHAQQYGRLPSIDASASVRGSDSNLAGRNGGRPRGRVRAPGAMRRSAPSHPPTLKLRRDVSAWR